MYNVTNTLINAVRLLTAEKSELSSFAHICRNIDTLKLMAFYTLLLKLTSNPATCRKIIVEEIPKLAVDTFSRAACLRFALSVFELPEALTSIEIYGFDCIFEIWQSHRRSRSILLAAITQWVKRLQNRTKKMSNDDIKREYQLEARIVDVILLLCSDSQCSDTLPIIVQAWKCSQLAPNSRAKLILAMVNSIESGVMTCNAGMHTSKLAWQLTFLSKIGPLDDVKVLASLCHFYGLAGREVHGEHN